MITVDTHIIIWDALKPELLSLEAKEAICKANSTDGIILCEISFWEIAMLIHKKRIDIPVSYMEFISLIKASNNYKLKGITPEIAELSVRLPGEINQDPADRIICSTSIIMNSPLVTADENLRKSSFIKAVW